MKPKTKETIIVTLLCISFVSFIVMIWGLFIHLSIWGFFAVPVFGFSFMIALIIGTPNDEGKGIFSSFKDDGL